MKNVNRNYSVSVGMTLVSSLLFYEHSYAYIDPGTTSVVFSAIGYILAGLAVAFSFLIIPFRKLYRFFKEKIKGKNTEN